MEKLEISSSLARPHELKASQLLGNPQLQGSTRELSQRGLRVKSPRDFGRAFQREELDMIVERKIILHCGLDLLTVEEKKRGRML